MTNPAPEKPKEGIEGTFEIKVFQADRAAMVHTETLKNSSEIEPRLKDLTREYHLGTYITVADPGVYMYTDGTIHVNKI